MRKTSTDPRDQRIAELEALLAQAQELILQLQQQLAQLQQQNAQLQLRIGELERAAKRQATPFARRKRKEKHKKSGRRAGEGQFAHRQPPEPADVDQTKEAPLAECPECGGALIDMKAHEQ